jgi:hypothetical protein
MIDIRTRNYCSLGIEICSDEIMPVLHIYPNLIEEIIHQLSSTLNTDCLAVLTNNISLSESEKRFLEHRSPKTSSLEHYRLVWIGSSVPENKLNSFLTLKIPVTMRAASEGIKDFEIDRTK